MAKNAKSEQYEGDESPKSAENTTVDAVAPAATNAGGAGASAHGSCDTPAATPAAKSGFEWRSLNTLAVVSLATSVSGYGAIAGVITGHIALAQLKSGEGKGCEKKGRWMAITGLVVGYAWIAFAIIRAILGFALHLWGSRHGIEFGGFGGLGYLEDSGRGGHGWSDEGFGGMQGDSGRSGDHSGGYGQYDGGQGYGNFGGHGQYDGDGDGRGHGQFQMIIPSEEQPQTQG